MRSFSKISAIENMAEKSVRPTLTYADECHHIASAQGQALMQRIRAKYVYGLSATPNRSDRLDDIIYMLLGPVRHKYTAKEQADALIAESDIRNEQLTQDNAAAVSNGRTPVILTKLKRHAETLAKQLAGRADHVFLIYGNQTEKQNQEIKTNMMAVPDGESLILIATGQKIGEGFNFPRLDTLMLAAPIKFEGRLVQYVGRLNRIYEGKKDVIVYDYVDTHIGIFDQQYKSRLAAYRKLGYRVLSDPVAKKQQVNAIYDRRDYCPADRRRDGTLCCH